MVAGSLFDGRNGPVGFVWSASQGFRKLILPEDYYSEAEAFSADGTPLSAMAK